MKKLVLILAGLTISGLGYGQLYYPNGTSGDATAWVRPMWTTNFNDYIGVYPSDGSVVSSNTGNILSLTFDTIAGALPNRVYQFRVFDLGATGNSELIDMSAHKFVYIKLKGKVGDLFTINVKHLDKAEDADGYISGYDLAQPIACTDYRWYKFDFSANTEPFLSVNEIEISSNPGVLKYTKLEIDSIILGDFKSIKMPTIPNLEKYAFAADMSNDYWKGLSPSTSANTFRLANSVFEATEVSTADVGDGFGFTAYKGNNNRLVDISARRIVKIRVKSAAGDVIRVNLKSGTGYNFIDGYAANQTLTTNGYEDLTFDFSSLTTGNFAQIIAADVILNPDAHDDKTFYIEKLQIGDDICQDRIDRIVLGTTKASANLSKSFSVFPNPSTGHITIETTLEGLFNLHIISATGQIIKTQKVSKGEQITGLAAGVYIFELSNEQGLATTKVVVK